MLLSSYMYRFILLTFFISLSACQKSDNHNQDNKSVSLKNAELVISEAGVGPINAQTPFNIHDITQALQKYDYHVEELKTTTEGESYPVIRVSTDTHVLLLINPDTKQQKIFSVIVKDKHVGNSLGHWLGMKYGSIYSYGRTEQCTPGSEGLSGKVLCYAPKSANVIYMFGDKEENNFPDGELPPIDALSEWDLEAIIWKPKG